MNGDLHKNWELAVAPEVTVATWILKQETTQISNNNAATRHSATTHSAFWSHIMADNKKQEKDFTVEVDTLLPDAASLAKVGRFEIWILPFGRLTALLVW